MKQIKTRISSIMICLLVGISMLFPTISSVHANETYSELQINVVDTEYTLTFQCISDTNTPLPCFNHNAIDMLGQDEFTSESLIENSNSDYVLSKIEDVNTKVSIYAFRYHSESAQLQYKESDTSEWTPWTTASEDEKSRTVNMIFEEVPMTDLPVIQAWDTITDGITMNLFNYTANKNNNISENNINNNHKFKFINKGLQINDGSSWNQGGALRQGLVENTLNNGYPKLTITDKESLSYLFNPDEEANGKVTYANVNRLLQKLEDGSYVFDSKNNFAMFNQKKNEFLLSTEVGGPNRSGAAFEVGNFLPFDVINTTKGFRNIAGSKIYNLTYPDFHFGLTMEANFLQPKDGIYHDQNMIFDFSGDDDVWVFIDDVLVLDLGGIHGAQSGSINFANGEVIINDAVSTTIKQQFEKANVAASFDGNTFADFTKHTIKFFYLERGAGASNCKLRINLPIMPKNGFAVSKQVSNINEATALNDTYTFRAYVDTNNNGEYSDDELLRGTPYQIGNETYSTDANGLFTLQAGELAEFKEQWTENLPFKVEELNIDANRYQNVTITSNNGAVGSYDSTTGIASSGSLIIGQHVLVAFNNEVSDALTTSLQIQKKISNGKNDDAFQMIAKINGEVYQGSYTVNDGTETRTEATSDGIITIKQNEIAAIEKLPANTTFEVVESLASVNAEYQKYSNDVAYEFDPAEQYGVNEPVIENGAKGSVVQGKATLLHVTNTLIYGKLQVVKQIDTANFANGDPIFTFKIERLNKNGETIHTQYRSVRFDSTLDAQSFIIDQLPLGNYRVSELTTLRYQAVGDVSLTDTIKEADQTIIFNYNNRVVNDQYYSHTDIVSNHVEYKKDENGKIIDVITSQDTLETPAE